MDLKQVLKNHHTLLYIAGSLVAAVLLSIPQYSQGHFSYVQSIDEGDSGIPQIIYFVSQLMNGGLCFWWPNSVSGTDFFGATVIASKTNVLLFALCPPWMAYVLFRVMAYFLAIYSTCLLMKRYLPVYTVFAVLAGVLFIDHFLIEALLGHGFSMSLVPLVMLYFSGIERLSVRSVLLSWLCGVIFGLTGHFTQTVFMIYYVFLFCLVFRTRYIRHWVFHMAAFTLGHILIQLPDILAVVTTAPISHRAVDLWSAHSRIDPLIANFWPTVSELTSRTTGLFTEKGLLSWKYVARFISDYRIFIIIVVSFIFVRREPATLLKLVVFYLVTLFADAYTIPLIGKIVTSLLGEHFILSRLFAKGIDTRVWMVKPLTLAMIFMFCIDRIVRSMGSIHKVNGARDLIDLCRPADRRKGISLALWYCRRLLTVGLPIFIVCCSLGSHLVETGSHIKHQRIGARKGYQNFANYYEHPMLRELAAKRPDFQNYRVVTMQNCLRYNVSGYNTQYGFQTADGYNSSFPRRYLDFWRLIIFGTTENIGKGRVFPSQAYLFSELTPSNMNLLSLANVEYFISAQPLEQKGLVPLPSSERDRMNTALIYPFHIYRNERALPRVFAPASIDLFTDQSALIEAMKTRDVQEFRDRAIVASPDLNGMDLKAGRQGDITVSGFTFQGDRVSFQTDSPKGGLVVVLNSYSPFWKIVKGGVTDRVLPVYHAFQGILVKPGRQEVVVRYMPPYWRK